jgi:hypothetical protein
MHSARTQIAHHSHTPPTVPPDPRQAAQELEAATWSVEQRQHQRQRARDDSPPQRATHRATQLRDQHEHPATRHGTQRVRGTLCARVWLGVRTSASGVATCKYIYRERERERECATIIAYLECAHQVPNTVVQFSAGTLIIITIITRPCDWLLFLRCQLVECEPLQCWRFLFPRTLCHSAVSGFVLGGTPPESRWGVTNTFRKLVSYCQLQLPYVCVLIRTTYSMHSSTSTIIYLTDCEFNTAIVFLNSKKNLDNIVCIYMLYYFSFFHNLGAT